MSVMKKKAKKGAYFHYLCNKAIELGPFHLRHKITLRVCLVCGIGIGVQHCKF